MHKIVSLNREGIYQIDLVPPLLNIGKQVGSVDGNLAVHDAVSELIEHHMGNIERRGILSPSFLT